MSTRDLWNDPGQAWTPYEPTAAAPWDLARVAHLHRRSGFAAPWATLRRDLSDGPGPSIGRLLVGEPRALDGLPAADFEAAADRMAAALGASGNLRSLQAAWLYRMVHTPHPLRERMTLFWHDHFATSNAKVNSTVLMRRQINRLRAGALGNFEDLLREMARDPAMLLWLDSASNHKARPNENYAREVMELFALGRGHYTERDVQEAARAFTGSFVRGEVYRAEPAEHDDGPKTILGRTGRFHGDDVARILLDEPACAEFLCTKLVRYLVSEVEMPSAECIAPLAAAFRESGYEIAVPVEMILRSRLFHDEAVRRQRVKSPVELTVGTVRALEIVGPSVSLDALAQATERMGQALFAPPSVAGWDWGPGWINTTTTMARTNFALALLGKDRRGGLGGRFDPATLATRHGRSANLADFLVELLVQDAFDFPARAHLRGEAPEVAALVLSAPEYQLA